MVFCGEYRPDASGGTDEYFGVKEVCKILLKKWHKKTTANAVVLGGEYRSRTDDLLAASQTL